MSCAPGSNCCADCASTGPVDVEARALILSKTRALVEAAEYAVADGAQCGSYGVFESAVIYLAGESDAMVSGGELCRRQNAALENLRVMYRQLDELLAAPELNRDRFVALLDAIESGATGLVDEAAVSSWAEFTRAYARNVGRTLGEGVKTALDAGAGAVGGVLSGLGVVWIALGALALVVYLKPSVLRKRAA